MVKITFTKPYLKPHTEHTVELIDTHVKAFVDKLKKRGYEIVDIENDL